MRTRTSAGRNFGFKLALGGLFAVLLALANPIATKAQTDVINPDALVAGQGLRRAGDFLDWSLGLYQGNENASDFFSKEKVSQSQTLREMWWYAFKLCLFLYLAVALVIGFGFIFKAQWIDRWRRNLPWLLVSLVGAALSYVILTFVMQLVANAMAIFMKTINADALLQIKYKYSEVQGLTSADIGKLEVVRNTIMLLRIATATAYAVGGILLLRVVVLWMLTVVVPFVMPFIAFPITQSLGRIWVREFVRWLLVGPLIALFLFVSNKIWTSGDFPEPPPTTNANATQEGYGSATEIGIKPPSSSVSSFDINTSAGTTDTDLTTDSYTKYIISLIMLWVSILLPWLLLRFAINLMNEASVKWYERNRESSFVKQLERIMKPLPPARPPTGPAGSMLGLKEKLLLPARELHIAPAAARQARTAMERAAQEPTRAGVQITEEIARQKHLASPISTTNTLKLAGLSQTGDVIEKLTRSREENQSLTELTRLEQKPTTVSEVVSEIEKLQKPEVISNTTDRQRISDLKDHLIVNEAKADHTARAIITTVKNDTNKLATQSIKGEMREKTYTTIKENATKVIEKGEVTNVDARNQVQELTNLITQYQQTSSAKQGEKTNLSQQIDHMAKVVAEKIEQTLPSKHEMQSAALRQGEAMAQAMNTQDKREEQRAGATFSAPGGGLAAGLTVRRTDPGRALIKSLHFLNTSELSYTSSDEGISRLLTSTTNLDEAVPDTEIVNDYEESREQWLKYYRTAAVPVSETIKDRGDWLRSQITTQQAALDKIASGDYSARREGLDQLSKIMPFLLMGDYSLTEVILYLKAKIAAAEQVSKEQTGGSGAQPQEQEEEKVELERHNTAVSKPLTSALEENP